MDKVIFSGEEGSLIYMGTVMDPAEASSRMEKLLAGIVWRQDELKLFGKFYRTERKVAWYADAGKNYRYSGSLKEALPWTEELLELKQMAERLCGEQFNSCLLNLYHNGNEGMGWHSDDEPDLGPEPAIASISFGAERPFFVKHKSLEQKHSLILEHGSLLLMKGKMQQFWKHSLPKRKRVSEPRVNLTFRRIL